MGQVRAKTIPGWFKQLAVATGLASLIWLFFKNINLGYNFHWAVLYEVNPTYKEVFGTWLLKGFWLTVNITLVSSLFSLLVGTIFGIARLSRFKPIYWLATAYVELFRNTPLLVQMFFWYFAFPMALPDPAVSWLNGHNFEFTAAVISLSAYTGAYVAEVVRAGIQAVPFGHVEAATSSGLSYSQMLRHVVLPQAFRIIIPPLGSEMLNNMKNSSLAMTIGVAELCWQSQQIESFTFKGFEATCAASAIYLFLCLAISVVMNSINHHLKVGGEDELTFFDQILGWAFSPVKWLLLFLLSTIAWSFSPVFSLMQPHSKAPYGPSPVELQILPFLKVTSKGMMLVLILGFIGLVGKGLYGFNWGVIFANLKPMLIWSFPDTSGTELFMGLGGLALSFFMAVLVIFFSFFIGIAVGLGRLSDNTLINTPSVLYIEIIRGNPLIMVIFWVYFFSPIVTGIQVNVFWSATIAFIIFSGAYLAEIVRAGVEAIPGGQFEAAKAAGLSYWQTMGHIILPQALKIMIPAFVNQFITIFKDTSLAYIIGVFELTTVAQTISNRLMFYPFEIYVTIGVLYFICCYSMSLLAQNLEQRLGTTSM
ncbi:MAG: amino acid ABC transporter permease [Desulfobacterales bacterium]|nr:amino acid ABC transporter permease [Desulfobacterales bacterium]